MEDCNIQMEREGERERGRGRERERDHSISSFMPIKACRIGDVLRETEKQEERARGGGTRLW